MGRASGGLAPVVDVWAIPAPMGRPDREALSAACHDLLDDYERAALSRFRLAGGRLGYAASHVLLRLALSASPRATQRQVEPRRWQFTRSDHGQPAITSGIGLPQLNFSLSRCDGLAVVAVSDQTTCPVGVDAEPLDRPVDPLPDDVALSPAERARLADCPANQRSAQFISLWTLKEAYAKMRGQGVSIPFEKLDMALNSAGHDEMRPCMLRSEDGTPPPPGVHLETRQVGVSGRLYCIALATQCVPGGRHRTMLHVLDSWFSCAISKSSLPRHGWRGS